MANSVDTDQAAFSEAGRSGSILFAKLTKVAFGVERVKPILPCVDVIFFLVRTDEPVYAV